MFSNGVTTLTHYHDRVRLVPETPIPSPDRVTAALIQPDGHFQLLCGEAAADTACVAALAHAVRAAGAELVLRLGGGGTQAISLHGGARGISLFAAPDDALLLLAHPVDTSPATLQDWARELLASAGPATAATQPDAPVARGTGVVSLSDALNVSAP